MATKTYRKNSELATLSKTSSRIAAAVPFLCMRMPGYLTLGSVPRTWPGLG
jgi:hypothetical protein